jgi:hypothetical protein
MSDEIFVERSTLFWVAMNHEFKQFKLFKPLQALSLVLPRDAGEERGEGLNRAKRLNGLNG